MKYDLLIKNGLVVLPTGKKVLDIAFKDEKIALIGEKLVVEASEVQK